MPMRMVASELRPGFRRPSGEMEREFVGGRWETQSWTRRETEGLESRFTVFFEDGLVVMIMVGPEGRAFVEGNGWEGRYV